ncbi:hypothetical protein B9Z55_026356 [Caenorhabditis nigoni]|uniref:G-protein coupled receptors family 1 profile domain-containing protein n=1 Tax=Caenorhabditis nigoni TaxID=1611254 RepID=A0A2G5T2Q5_9PELO|nr:hypothetical protein B9Z55_026356 [Caenorhabditis nigoni]
MPCSFRDSFLESERFLAISLHALTCFELPLHAFAAYLIIRKTPKTMGRPINAFNNFTMIAIGSNGLFTVIVMIVVYNPYRVAVKEMICPRNNTKNNSGINNSRNTNLFYSRKI